MSDLEHQRLFYATLPTTCPYLPGRMEQRVVTELLPDEQDILDQLSEAGFRRSQGWLYRPACPGCQACVSVRIPVARFVWTKGWRRIVNRNADLAVDERPMRPTAEQYALFRRYLQDRHEDGGMATMSEGDYAAMVARAPRTSRLVEFRNPSGGLAAVSLVDRIASGLSGVYTFFDPALERRSPGTFMILWYLKRAAELGLPYVYLGYWIEDCRKMRYKARFRPLERLVGMRWEPFDPPLEAEE